MTPPTYLERRWPNSPAFQAIAQRWCQDQSRLFLELVWGGYDRLLDQDFRVTPFSDTDEEKEQSLSILLALRIGQWMSGDEPFSLIHEPPEQTKRKSGRRAISAAGYRLHAQQLPARGLAVGRKSPRR